uniref:Uncharacterized protein n=1 Tax=Anguilla anguilla TaxID=7936 RepID=A0A0E9RYN9_ANGAN
MGFACFAGGFLKKGEVFRVRYVLSQCSFEGRSCDTCIFRYIVKIK